MHGTVSASPRGACRNVHRLLRPRQSRLTISTESSETGRQNRPLRSPRRTSGPGGGEAVCSPDDAATSVRFLVEMGMLICLGIGGSQLGGPLPVSVVLGVSLPLAAAGMWGRRVAPGASRRLGVEVTLFTAALLAVMP